MPAEPPAQDRAYVYTKARILDGELRGGEMISEGMIAQQLGVSRTPVREAFLQLKGEGLLRLYPKRGAVVVPVLAEEVGAVVEARELIETFAATKVTAAAEIAGELSRRLLAELAEQRRLADAGDRSRFVDSDQQFHRLIVAAGGNQILTELYDSLRDRQRRTGLVALLNTAERLEQIQAEHQGLAELLSRRDLSGYREALRAHLQGTRAAALGSD